MIVKTTKKPPDGGGSKKQYIKTSSPDFTSNYAALEGLNPLAASCLAASYDLPIPKINANSKIHRFDGAPNPQPQHSPESSSIILEVALWFARQGTPVFILCKNLKTPACKWKEVATTDEAQIRKWFGGSRKYNLGVVCGPKGAIRSLIVFDVDMKHGKNGKATLEKLEKILGKTPPTLTSNTPGLGEHQYFWIDASKYLIKNSVEGIGEGIDIRANGDGYVVGVGSHLEADADETGRQATGDYAFANKLPIAELPPAWCEFLAKKSEPHKPTVQYKTSPPRQEYQDEDLQSALNFLNAADSATWEAVMFSLKGSYGDAGYAQFDNWSSTAPDHYNEKENRKRWDSVKNPTKTKASIFQMAQDKGWKNPAKGQTVRSNTSLTSFTSQKNTVHPAKNYPPQLLPDSLPPVNAFDLDWLPNELGAWVQDTARRMSTPVDYIAMPLLVTLAGVIGRKVAIRPMEFDHWTVVVTLWAVMIGRPSLKKSAGISAALNFLQTLEAKERAIYQQQVEQYSYELELAALQKETIKGEVKRSLKNKQVVSASELQVDAPDKPIQRRYLINDVTMAALLQVLQDNPNGLTVSRDEIVGFLKTLDSEGNTGLRELLLEAWNGNASFNTDRVVRGKDLFVEGVCLSLLGGTQPGKLAAYLKSAVKGGASDDGLMQRFNPIWPDAVPYEGIDEPPNKLLKTAVQKIFNRLDTLTTESVEAIQEIDEDGQPDGLPYLRFDYQAQTLFKDWLFNHETRLRAGDLHPAMESHLGKYPKTLVTLALILHLVEVGQGAVGEISLLRAIGIVEYLESHANRAYASISMPDVDSAKQILNKLKSGQLSNPFKAREIYSAGWTGLDRETTNAALELLLEYRWLDAEELETGGRPTTVYYLNPLAGW
ncbi:MAG: DUF3987 domain-containing protein [Thiothrix sp.]|nr:MAG: DUF3987 domain-containing protein [Thiothrix sp.]